MMWWLILYVVAGLLTGGIAVYVEKENTKDHALGFDDSYYLIAALMAIFWPLTVLICVVIVGVAYVSRVVGQFMEGYRDG